MYLHLGGDVVVPKEHVIAIINSPLVKKTEPNKEFLQAAEEEGFIVPITDKSNVKSIIVTLEKVYLSPISSMTLKKRSDQFIDNVEEQTVGEPW